MASEDHDFDPTAVEHRDVGREMVDDTAGLGSVVAHLYRGEVDRITSWRSRLDSTTNWAVTVISGILAYAFSNEDVSHAIILVGMLIGVVFLVIEARRFQRYDVWRSRVRSMQENLFAVALDPSQGVEQRDWRRQLSDDYRRPDLRMPFRGALAHRLRRVYLPLLTGLLLVWAFRLSGAGEPLLEAAGLQSAPGWAVVTVVGFVYCLLAVIAVTGRDLGAAETDAAADHGDLES